MSNNLYISNSANIASNVIFGNNIVIKDNVTIEENVKIESFCVINENVVIKKGSYIGSHVVLGEYLFDCFDNGKEYLNPKTSIGENSIIRSHSVIYASSIIGENFQSGHRVTIRENTIIGKNTSIGTLCDLQGKMEIGSFVRIHSNVHIGQKYKIEDFVWIYPYVVLTNDPYPPMGKLKGVTIKRFAQVATSSIIMPGILIGENALVGAQSLVKRDVGDERVVVGVPAKDICSVRDIKDELGNQVYPWKEYLSDYRGYPWQKKDV
jgi:acetyltransferase-like isoleucine patch superfamily enzyme